MDKSNHDEQSITEPVEVSSIGEQGSTNREPNTPDKDSAKHPSKHGAYLTQAKVKLASLRAKGGPFMQNGKAKAGKIFSGCCTHLKANRRVQIAVVVILIIIVILLAITLFGGQSHKAQAKVNKTKVHALAEVMQQRSAPVVHLNALKAQLAVIENKLNQPNQTAQTLARLEQQIGHLTQVVSEVQHTTQVAHQDSAQSNQAIVKSSAQNRLQVKKLTAQIAVLNKQLIPSKFLPVNTLPFKVVGSAYWGNQLMISIALPDVSGAVHYRLMGVGEVFACGNVSHPIKGCRNWRLSTLTSSTAIFSSEHGKARVKVVLS